MSESHSPHKYSIELLDQTILVLQPYSDVKLTHADAEECIDNMVNLHEYCFYLARKYNNPDSATN